MSATSSQIDAHLEFLAAEDHAAGQRAEYQQRTPTRRSTMSSTPIKIAPGEELPILSILPAPSEWQMILQMGSILVKSGMLPAAIKTAEAAAAIILKGRELAIPPMQSFSHIHILLGRPTCSAELQLALLARGGVTWAWLEDGSQDRAVIEFRRPGFAPVRGGFSKADAEAAKLTVKDTWKMYQANMLRARAISNGARMIGPDLLAGMSYTPEEMGAEVDADGQPLEGRQPVAAPVETTGEIVDTVTGEILLPPGGAEKKERAPYWRFLDRCGELKAVLGDPAYYQVLRDFDLDHASEVEREDTATMRAVVNALKEEEATPPAPESTPATGGPETPPPATAPASESAAAPRPVVDYSASIYDGDLVAGIESLENKLGFTPRKRVDPRIQHAGHHTLTSPHCTPQRLRDYYNWLAGQIPPS